MIAKDTGLPLGEEGCKNWTQGINSTTASLGICLFVKIYLLHL